MRDITEVWQRIKAHNGEAFRTKTGLPFTYDVAGNTIVVSRSPTYPFPPASSRRPSNACPSPAPTTCTTCARRLTCGRSSMTHASE